MNRRIALAIGAAALIGVGALSVATIGHAGSPEGWHCPRGMGMEGMRGGHMWMMLERYDADGDGKVSQAEIDSTRQARLKQFDADGDGSLTLVEYQALWLDAMREEMVDRFQEHDNDGDGKVTAEEFTREHARIVRHMDQNDDGIIDKADMMSMMMKMRHRDGDDGDAPGPEDMSP